MSYIVRLTSAACVDDYGYLSEFAARREFEASHSAAVQLVQLLKRTAGGALVELSRRKRTVDGCVSTPVHPCASRS